MALLRIQNVRRVFSTRLGLTQCVALRDVSFDVEQGEFVAIMGPSGSGKTTLLNIVASLDKPTSGTVELNGRSFADISERDISKFRREHLGFVFQDFNLLDTFSLKDNILLPLVLSDMPAADMEARLAPVADMLGITALLGKFPYEVSGGEKQRAAVARAVITNPDILLADEPTGALDSKASGALLRSFSELNAQGRTLLMVTHSALAAGYASRVLFIRDGRIYSQLHRGTDTCAAFFERVAATLTLMESTQEDEEGEAIEALAKGDGTRA